MNILEMLLATCSTAIAAALGCWWLFRPQGRWPMRVLSVLTPTLLVAGLAKVHQILPSDMIVLDQIAFWAVVAAIFVQGISGLLTIAVRDLNPAKEKLSDLEAFLNIPRSTSLLLETEILDDLRLRNEQNISAAKGERFEYIESSLLGKLRYDGNSPLSFWYSRPARLRKKFSEVETIQVYSLRRPFDLEIWDIEAFQRLLRYISIFALAVVGLTRFVHGEPILNLFGS